MLAVLGCIAGVVVILAVAEYLWRQKILKGEGQRKFVHILVGSFAASWPWLISWHSIQLLGLAMTAGVLLNRSRGTKTKLHFLGGLSREGYGDVFAGLVIVLCALLTDVKIFFALAILHMALADGFAAVIGKQFGQSWRYKVFNQYKSVLGSMTFWLISVAILGVGLLGAHDTIGFREYGLLLIALPPILTIAENVASLGLDNILVPLMVLLALHIAQIA